MKSIEKVIAKYSGKDARVASGKLWGSTNHPHRNVEIIINTVPYGTDAMLGNDDLIQQIARILGKKSVIFWKEVLNEEEYVTFHYHPDVFDRSMKSKLISSIEKRAPSHQGVPLDLLIGFFVEVPFDIVEGIKVWKDLPYISKRGDITNMEEYFDRKRYYNDGSPREYIGCQINSVSVDDANGLVRYAKEWKKAYSNEGKDIIKNLETVFAPLAVSAPRGARPEEGIGAYLIGSGPAVARVFKIDGRWFARLGEEVRGSQSTLLPLGEELTIESVSKLVEALNILS